MADTKQTLRAARQARSPFLTEIIECAPGDASVRIEGDLELAILQDPAASWRLNVLESVDGGKSWTYASFGLPEFGSPGRIEQPWYQIDGVAHKTDARPRLFRGEIVLLDRGGVVGARFEVK